ncbi:MAG: hypothetical protein ACJ8FY_15000 [Gemmataceae bacterium]
MTAALQAVDTYRKLADWHHNHGQPQHRDRFLVLAADSAWAEGRADDAEVLRQRLLRVNPHHLLKPFSSFGQALRSPDVESYVGDLRRSYPIHVASDLLASLPGRADIGPQRSSKILPPTQPVIDISTPSDGADAVGIDTLRVYSLKQESPETKPTPRPQTVMAPASIPMRKPAQAKPVRAAGQLSHGSQPRSASESFQFHPPTPASRWASSGGDSENLVSSGLCMALAAAMVAASLTLAGYALIGPILGKS